MTTFTKVFAIGLAAVTLAGASMTASAATVLCPGMLTATLTRQVEVTGALAGGECYYKSGNINGDSANTAFALSGATAVSLIEKDIAPNGGGSGSLLYTQNAGGDAGTWTMGSNLWASFAEIFVAFHFGNGSGNPDSFMVELNPGTLTGTWALIPTNLANGLSNIYLFGRGTPSTGGGSGSTGGQVSTPSSAPLVALGLGLIGFGYWTRRRQAA